MLGEILNDPKMAGFDIDEKLCYQPNERGDFFPIITPAYPCMNSTYNVSLTTRNVMITELEKAMEITKQMMKNDRTQKITWKRLFKKFPFFKAYLHFVQIQILSRDEETRRKWKGYAESKIRLLLSNLEKFNREFLYSCLEFRPYPKGYQLNNKTSPEDGGFEIDDTYYFGIRVKTNDGSTREHFPQIDLSDARGKFFKKIQEFISDPTKLSMNELLEEKKIDLDIRCLTRDELPD